MRKAFAALSLAAFMTGGAIIAAPAFGQGAVPAYVASAIADPNRPAADKARDAAREPAAMLAFAGIQPGSLVAEWIPGGGYFTRIFTKAVGSDGHVFAIATAGRNADRLSEIVSNPAYAGALTVVAGDLLTAKTPRPVDVVWTSQNYHDMNTDIRTGVNKASFDMLKPGGTYIVLDHEGAVGSDNAGLHRVDPELVKRQVLAAGFEFVGASEVLHNPADDHRLAASDSALGRDTDQFVLKFRKPG